MVENGAEMKNSSHYYVQLHLKEGTKLNWLRGNDVKRFGDRFGKIIVCENDKYPLIQL